MIEKMSSADSDKRFSLLWRFLQGTKRYFLISVLSAGVTALADMLQPQIVRTAIDCVIGGQTADAQGLSLWLLNLIGNNRAVADSLWILAVAIVAVAIVKVASQYTFRVYNTKAAETLVKAMRDQLYAHIERLPFSWHMHNRTGDIIQRCTSDIETTKNFLSEQLTSIFRIIILLVFSISFMLSMHIGLTAIAFIPMPFIILYSVSFHKKIRAGFTDCDENEGKLSSIAQENLTGVRVVRAFGRERAEVDKFQKQNDYYTNLWISMGKTLSRFWSTSDVLSGIQVMLVVIFGSILCVRGELSEGAYVAFISYNAMLVWPIRQLGRMISELSKAGVSLDRVAYIMNSPIEQDDPEAFDAPMDGDIAFEHVSFGYEDTAPLLHDINFTMKAGTTLGILGGTGSGKSTLMLLLDKLYPIDEGCGRITIGGTDIRKIRTSHLRKHIGMVLQEPFLFSGTIAENIGMSASQFDMADVRSASQAAALDEAILSFNSGYETIVGERGVTLSGGQKQRTAIARMLMANTPIMIFDDSLSAVDTETDSKIRKALSKKFGTASIILISHRITTLASADKILVLDHGRIAEEGTHEELKSAGGIYQKIYEAQRGSLEVSR